MGGFYFFQIKTHQQQQQQHISSTTSITLKQALECINMVQQQPTNRGGDRGDPEGSAAQI
jgi:hypothetical protein